jgi:hypothetical protein
MVGDALTCAVAIIQAIDAGELRLPAHEVLFMHFVTYGPDSVKARRIHLWIGDYHRLLNEARAAVAPFIEAILDRSVTP